MDQNAVEQAVTELSQAGVVEPSALQGCTVEEIGRIEAKFHLHLPKLYKEFLARMGKAPGQFLVGSDYLFPVLLHLRNDAETLIRETGGGNLDPADFVFMGHQGYEFLFFKVTDATDPPVFLLMEGEEPRQVYLHFSEWLLSCVADEIEAFKSLRHASPQRLH